MTWCGVSEVNFVDICALYNDVCAVSVLGGDGDVMCVQYLYWVGMVM